VFELYKEHYLLLCRAERKINDNAEFLCHYEVLFHGSSQGSGIGECFLGTTGKGKG
jgi:hypothetical protein